MFKIRLRCLTHWNTFEVRKFVSATKTNGVRLTRLTISHLFASVIVVWFPLIKLRPILVDFVVFRSSSAVF